MLYLVLLNLNSIHLACQIQRMQAMLAAMQAQLQGGQTSPSKQRPQPQVNGNGLGKL